MRVPRSLLLVVACWLLTTVFVSCGSRQAVFNQRITGTCEGACNRYVACKGTDSTKLVNACVAECQEMFSGEEGLKAFESLPRCEDVISFVEGDKGRAPGTTP